MAARYFKAEVAGYTERGAAQNLQVSDDDFHVFDIEAGASLAVRFLYKDIKVIPQVNFTRVQQLNRTCRYVKTHLLGSNSDEFEPVDNFKRGYTKLGGTLLVMCNEWLSAYVNANTRIAAREKHDFEARCGMQIAF